MAATKPGVLLVLLLYIVKIHLVIAQAMPGPCGGACTGYGFCGGIYPTVFDTSNTDPLDVLLPVLLIAMCKKLGAAAAAEEAAASSSSTAPPPASGADTCCGCYNGCCVPQCCKANSQCGSGQSAGCAGCAGCACVCGGSASSGCGSVTMPNPCAGCTPDTGFPACCSACPAPKSANCGGCMCC